MAKRQITRYVFQPGLGKSANLRPNAYALLTANKQFILDQLVAFINYNVANNIAPYVGYTFDPSKCYRDDGFILDAYAHDLRYGGNLETRNVSSYFWIDGRPQITGAQTPEITGQNYVRDLINNFIFSNTPVNPTYGNTSSTQTFLSNSAESGSNTVITNLVLILTNTIEQGLVAIPEKEYGVSSVKIIGKFTSDEILLITNTDKNEVIYNFTDPAAGGVFNVKFQRSSGGGYLYDLDYPKWWQTDSGVTTIHLEYDTSSMLPTDSIQIFSEEPYQTIRPWDFGTDAIERMRVAQPQAMLDADFEYGLQPTKWQALSLMRSYPSIFEVPGTDLAIVDINTDASTPSGGFGSSLITVQTGGPHGLSIGLPITVKGLNSAVTGFGRAEGSFLVQSIPSSTTFTYYSQSKVGTTNGQSLVTNFSQIRQGGFYTGASIGEPTFTVASNGTEATVTTLFSTSSGSTRIAFSGTAPTVGSPISGSGAIVPGTSITGVAGDGTSTTVNVLNNVSSGDTSFVVTDGAGLQEGYALDDGTGNTIFISSLSGTTVNLSDEYGASLNGSNGSTTGASGTNILPVGVGATFNISRSAGNYNATPTEDSTVNGQNYAVGDRLTVTGDNLGGTTPENDVAITVTEVDSGGAIINFNVTGTAITGGATYTEIAQTSTSGFGINFRIDVERAGGSGQYTNITLDTGGSGHQPGDEITFAGTLFDGTSPANDIVIRVDGVAFGTDAVVDFTVLSGIGVSGDALYEGEAPTNVNPTGTGATFNVTRQDGVYSLEIANGGSGYFEANKILIAGDDLDGSSPINDATVTITEVTDGAITAANIEGTPFLGDEITLFSALSISDPLISSISPGSVLSVGAIATIELGFDSAHGLVPGAGILTTISSAPAPGFDSTATTNMPSSGTWAGISFSTINDTGYFAAVASTGTAGAYSTDGTNWQASVLPASTAWSAVASGVVGEDTYTVAVGSGTNAAYSTDGGQTWSAATLPSSGTWTGVAYFDGVFVAVRSGSNAAARSTDGGETWSAATLPSSSTWTSVAGGIIGGVPYFIAVASGGTAAAYSNTGGASWVASTLPASAAWSSIAFGGDRFVAISTTSSTISAYSTDGQSWTQSALPVAANWNAITFGTESFVAVAFGSDNAVNTYDGANWFANTLDGSANWDSIAFGQLGGGETEVYVTTGNGQNVATISLTPSNHQLAAGPFYVTEVPDAVTLRYPARTQGIIDDVADMSGIIYARSESFFTHRPFDGGVQLGTGGPQHAAAAIRQSKKYIRYQSGKGIMYTTGALFAPNYNIVSAVADGTEIGSLITFRTDDTDHGVQAGGIVEISGMQTSTYNGTYTVESVVNERSFRVRTTTVLTATTGVLGPDTKMSVKNWHGATVRTGAFDEQNGLFFQYDGQRMAVVKRSSTLQIAGTVTVEVDSNAVAGDSDTRFQDQLTVGDQIVIRGMTHTVTSIIDQQNMTIAPDYRGAVKAVNAKVALTVDDVIPQEEWNLDTLDGNGPSQFILDPTKMQMIGIQYSWYAAGFIEYMLRGADGKFIFFHRIRNSNNNTEAYMRTANLPVRYEVKNESARNKLRTEMTAGSSSIDLFDAYYFPTSGTVLIDNELISFTSKTGNTLGGLTRGASLSNFAAGANRSYSGGASANHSAGAGVILVSTTITPVISHWGSALLTDGMFDEDRGYLFSYSANGVSVTTTRQTAFLMRLAPSVSNAIIGDLGERELINRAQLLLDSIEVTSDGTASDDAIIRGGIVIEGILNPQNYPINPADISWGGLSGLAQGGQPSFVQIAPGGSVNWNGGASLTTATATVSDDIDTGFVYDGFQNGERTSPLPLTLTSFNTAGPILEGAQIFSQNPNAYTGTGGRTFTVNRVQVQNNRVDVFYNDQFGGTSSTATQSTSTEYKFVFPTYEGITNRLLFTQASWVASGASVGTSVASSDTNWPAGTAVSSVTQRQLGGVTFFEVTFNQSSVEAISASDTVTFEFGNPPYAQPGETVFSFIAVPGERATLTLDKLKELTNTTIGGRGTFPNGPDVLAINIYKVSGAALSANVVVKWSEAQA